MYLCLFSIFDLRFYFLFRRLLPKENRMLLLFIYTNEKRRDDY